MKSENRAQSKNHPKWWLLSMLIPLTVGMMVVEHRWKLSSLWHQIVGITIILIIYGLMAVWLWTNSEFFAHQSAHRPLGSAYYDSMILDANAEESEAVLVYTFDQSGNTLVYKLAENGKIIDVTAEQPMPQSGAEIAEINVKDTIRAIEDTLQFEYNKLAKSS